MNFKADTLLLFGATGDLAQRMLLPSLCALHSDGLLDPALQIIGTARSEMNDAEFRNFARAALEKHLRPERRGGTADFLNRLHYQPLDVTDPEAFAALAERIGERCSRLAIFLSTAPNLFETTIDGLAKAGLTCEGARDRVVDLAAGREIEAERLLEADPRPVASQARGGEPVDGDLEQVRRGRQEDRQAAAARADLLAEPLERVGAGDVERLVVQPVEEIGGSAAPLRAQVLLERGAGKITELGVVHLRARGADDL